jgi:hypothetical protein
MKPRTNGKVIAENEHEKSFRWAYKTKMMLSRRVRSERTSLLGHFCVFRRAFQFLTSCRYSARVNVDVIFRVFRRHRIPVGLIFAMGFILVEPSIAEVRPLNGVDAEGGYLVVPDTVPSDGEERWVAVSVHGAGGLKNSGGAVKLANLLGKDRVIVIAPSFKTGYQMGNGAYAEELISIYRDVAEEFSVHEKMFVHGFSGGAQFAHRFAMNEPGQVLGVSAHSAGSWATGGGFGSMAGRARGIPFVISCGEADRAYSVKGYPHTRIEWYEVFRKQMEGDRFLFKGATWPGVGHKSSPGVDEMAKECFLLATAGPLEGGAEGWQGDVGALIGAVSGGDSMADLGSEETGGEISDETLAVVRAAQASLETKAPDAAATLRFLAAHPAAEWCDQEEFKALAAHCMAVAKAYRGGREASGESLRGEALERFEAATKGL